MKKILLILFTTSISISLSSINIKILNNTSAREGWKAKIESNGIFITRNRYIRRKNNFTIFYNIPEKSTVQITSLRNIGKGTAISSSKITLRKDINYNKDITIVIDECNSTKKDCINLTKNKKKYEEEEGRNNKHYYLKTEEYNSTKKN